MTLAKLLEYMKSLMEDNNLTIAFLEVGSNKVTGITYFEEHIGPLNIPITVSAEHAQKLISCDFLDQVINHVTHNDCHWTTSGQHAITEIDYSLSIDQNAIIKITLSWRKS